MKGDMSATRLALQRPVETFIPGHGPTGDRRVPREQLQRIGKLYDAVARPARQGESDFEMKDGIGRELDESRHWTWFDRLGRLISYVHLEVETGSFRCKTTVTRSRRDPLPRPQSASHPGPDHRCPLPLARASTASSARSVSNRRSQVNRYAGTVTG